MFLEWPWILFCVITILANVTDHFNFRITAGYGNLPPWLAVSQYLFNGFGGLSRLLNWLLKGDIGESYSSRCGREKHKTVSGWIGYYIVGLWFFLSKFNLHHCKRYISP